MSPAFKGAVAHKEVILDVPHHALVFALGPGSIRLAGPRGEAVVESQIQKALVEARHPPQDGPALHISGYPPALALRDPAKVLQAADQAFVGVLGILAVGAPKVEAPGIAQFVHNEGDLALPGYHNADLAPVSLQLLAGFGLKPHRLPAGTQGTLGRDVLRARWCCRRRSLPPGSLAEITTAFHTPSVSSRSTVGLYGSSLHARRFFSLTGAVPRFNARLTVLGCTPSCSAMSFW